MDAFKNFAKVQVSTGYDAAATSIALTAGHGAKLPAAPFNATWWNSTDFADPSDDPNVEIVRVTAIATDTLTVTRAQESTSASTKNTASKTYKLIAGLTAKTFNTDLGSTGPIVANGRLTLESGTPVTLDAGITIDTHADMVNKATIYFTPYQGNRISLYDGANWNLHAFSELTLPLGTLVTDKNYDVFVYNNAGTLTLEMSAAWTSDIARADALTLQDGIYVKSGATTRRYVGTFRTTSTTTTEDSLVKRFLWNYYNRRPRDMYKTDNTVHTYNDTPFRPWNNDANNHLGFVSGIAEDAVLAALKNYHDGGFAIASIGVDTLAAYRGADAFVSTEIAGSFGPVSANVTTTIAPQIGYHKIISLQQVADATARTYRLMDLTATCSC